MLPLEGLKIIDISRQPTVFASMVMADLGADVISVQDAEPEGRGRGDPARSAAFAQRLRNKRSIALDLKQKGAQDVFYRLARDADVVLEGFRPGVARRLGVDYETISKVNPRIVYCSVTGFGQTGPYRDLPGHEHNFIALAGAMSLFGEKGRKPVPAFNLLADNAAAGLLSCIGVLAALRARETTGRGQYIDLSMTDGTVYIMGHVYGDYFATGNVPERGVAASSGGTPQYDVYQASDGKYISIAAIEPRFFANLMRLVGREDLIGQPRGSLDADELRAYLETKFREKSRDEWFDLLVVNEIPAGKVYTLDEAPADPQLQDREMFVDIDDGRFGAVRQVGLPLKFSETPGSVRSLGAAKGEHSARILRELGYSDEEISELKESGAVLMREQR
jgi:crotonobetainyl-CoA:carnitine CoA-transferase CaiB-like acyl-CoA transferase